MFTVVLVGGSIAERQVSNKKELRGKSPNEKSLFFDSRESAVIYAKRLNKSISPGEKKYYGLKYVSCEVLELAGKKYFNGK